MPLTWHILTGEYPPTCGGVGDYSAALAAALAAAGDAVHVWTPARVEGASGGGVHVHVLPDAFGGASRESMRRAWQATAGTVLLQYVPNAIGLRGANLPFCWWFSRLHRDLADVRVMFHEPYFYFDWSRPWAPGNALALAQRPMARLLLRGADRVYYSTATWRRYLPAPQGAETLPIPSTIPVAEGPAPDRRFAVGHFGTYGAHVGDQLRAVLPPLTAQLPGARIALLGDGGPRFRDALSRTHANLASVCWAPGRLDAPALASALRACDVLVQPYPDGITTRRTSAMAGMRNGVPMVTSNGALTEEVWAATGAVALAPAGDADAFVRETVALLLDAPARESLGRRAAAVYASHFSIEHTVAILRGAAAA